MGNSVQRKFEHGLVRASRKGWRMLRSGRKNLGVGFKHFRPFAIGKQLVMYHSSGALFAMKKAEKAEKAASRAK